MIYAVAFTVAVISGGLGSGPPAAFDTCTKNESPLSLNLKPFHGMPDDPDSQIPTHCLFAVTADKKFHGSFHFGFSEMEYDQHWFVDAQGRVLMTRSQGGWGGSDGGQWVTTYAAGSDGLTLSGHQVLQGKKVIGHLVVVKVAGQEHLGFLDLATQAGQAAEIGFYTPYERQLPGEMPQASRVLLTPDYLKLFSKKQLKIMRNEIFARHGHRFKAGGAMEKHFQAQSWYQKLPAPKKSIQSLLTTLEKENIRRIQKAEKR